MIQLMVWISKERPVRVLEYLNQCSLFLFYSVFFFIFAVTGEGLVIVDFSLIIFYCYQSTVAELANFVVSKLFR